jgi:EAL domain-containing protein (putative c-di-GMP-specific phosphodiesterase class I)
MTNHKLSSEVLLRLSDLGIKHSIDDFGTGHSSLAYIKNLPVSEIKIDKSFIINMITSKNDIHIVQAAIELGHHLGLNVVAEGVENKETFDLLAQLGCDEAQGYFISRPMAAPELIKWLNESSWPLKESPKLTS